MKKFKIIVILSFHAFIIYGQNVNWQSASDVKQIINTEIANGKIFYSQFDWYSPRKTSSLQTKYSEYIGKTPLIYGVDFYYATGSWFSEEYKSSCRSNLISIVKQAWERDSAIPCFSWHLENPYIPTGTELYMGCRYRFGYPEYPAHHRYIINEILNERGTRCGTGSYVGKDNIGYANPREWFIAQCKEVADIINELVDKNGNPIPIIFRLWHECEDEWMWWGSSSCTVEEYKEFFILTQELIKKYLINENQILWAYCTDQYFSSEEEYLKRYPGNSYVDIIGYDDYSIARPEKLNDCIKRAQCVSSISLKYNKICAIFETSNNYEATREHFFRNCVSPIITAENVYLGIIQMWTSEYFNTVGEKEDRKWFLSQPFIIIK